MSVQRGLFSLEIGGMNFVSSYSVRLACTLSLTGKTKCMSKSGDCVVKHPAGFATGMALVVSGSQLLLLTDHVLMCSHVSCV